MVAVRPGNSERRTAGGVVTVDICDGILVFTSRGDSLVGPDGVRVPLDILFVGGEAFIAIGLAVCKWLAVGKVIVEFRSEAWVGRLELHGASFCLAGEA